MLNKLNHIIPDLLLKPRFRFYRHLSMQITIALITINNLSQDSNISVGDRLWIWLLAWAILDAIVYVNACLLVPRMLLTGNIKRYFISISAILFLMVSCNVFFYFYFGNVAALTAELIFTVIYSFSNICLMVAGITALCLFIVSIIFGAFIGVLFMNIGIYNNGFGLSTELYYAMSGALVVLGTGLPFALYLVIKQQNLSSFLRFEKVRCIFPNLWLLRNRQAYNKFPTLHRPELPPPESPFPTQLPEPPFLQLHLRRP